MTSFQNLTPVELKIAKIVRFLTFFTITQELDISGMSNYTFSDFLCLRHIAKEYALYVPSHGKRKPRGQQSNTLFFSKIHQVPSGSYGQHAES